MEIKAIKAVRMYDHGFMNQSFAFGGEEGKDMFDEQIIYRSSLQNFLIETDEGIILIDTGFKTGMSAPAKKLGAPLYMGDKVDDYMASFAALGYKPEQVTKILITHKHGDHSDCISEFPNAKVYISPEDADAMNLPSSESHPSSLEDGRVARKEGEAKLEGENIVRVSYKDGRYQNFPACEEIAPGLYFIEAKGHTKGNSIVILEHDGLYYMFHGDITYCDAALKANKLSIIFEDKTAARETLDRVRTFIKNNPTVYLSTHCPEGYENLEMKRVMKL